LLGGNGGNCSRLELREPTLRFPNPKLLGISISLVIETGDESLC
jgi:hypothetical protein